MAAIVVVSLFAGSRGHRIFVVECKFPPLPPLNRRGPFVRGNILLPSSP